MKKGFILAIACLILLSSVVSAQNFVIESVHAVVDGKSDRLDEHEDITVKHGSVLLIKVRFENQYTKDSEIEVDVELSGTILDIDKGDNIYEVEDSNIQPEDSGTVTLEFFIPYITEDDDFWLELEAYAEADNGDNYEYLFTHKIELNKPENELIISNLRLSKNVVGCDAKSTTIFFDILNTGRTDENDMGYIIKNDLEGIYIERVALKISEGEISPISEIINIRDLPAGEHTIDILAYCNDKETSVKKTISLTKESCGTQSPQTQPAQQQNTQTTTQNQPTTTEPTQPSTTTQQTTQTQSSRSTRVIITKEKTSKAPTTLIISTLVIIAGLVTYFVINKK